MKPTTVTRSLVRQVLRVCRAPLDLAEVFARRQGVDVVDWYPARAFEGIEGDVKRMVGAVLRDPVLVEEGYRNRARVDELRHAHRLRLQAEGQRFTAEARFHARHQAATEQGHALDRAAQALEHEHDAEADARRAEARQAARRQRSVVDTQLQESRASVRAAVASGGIGAGRRGSCRVGARGARRRGGRARPFGRERRRAPRRGQRRLTSRPVQTTRPRPVTRGRSRAVRRPGAASTTAGTALTRRMAVALRPAGVVVAVGAHELQVDGVGGLARHHHPVAALAGGLGPVGPDVVGEAGDVLEHDHGPSVPHAPHLEAQAGGGALLDRPRRDGELARWRAAARSAPRRRRARRRARPRSGAPRCPTPW